jgi:hypothetical protein
VPVLVLTVASLKTPAAATLALVLAIFGYGQRCGVFCDRSSRIGTAGAVRGASAVCDIDHHLCRISVMDAARGGVSRVSTLNMGIGSTRSFYFAVQQLSVLDRVRTSLSPRSCRCLSPTISNSCDVCQS